MHHNCPDLVEVKMPRYSTNQDSKYLKDEAGNRRYQYAIDNGLDPLDTDIGLDTMQNNDYSAMSDEEI